jgi:hypothetical protein
MTPEGAANTLAVCGLGWLALGVGLIKYTKDARGWGVLLLALGVVFMAAAGNLK